MTFKYALLGGVALMLATPVVAQEANIDGRVGKLEKEMRAVQRQVFPNGAGKFLEPEIQSPTVPKTTTSSSTATADLLVRVDALEAQLATLTGQVEQQGNNLRCRNRHCPSGCCCCGHASTRKAQANCGETEPGTHCRRCCDRKTRNR
jgi:hypothetical protein